MTLSPGIRLLQEITCPNCWEKFPPQSALAIAGHGDLAGDPMLEDESETRRFVPTRFTPECAAIDEFDTPSLELACPHCHLVVPRVLFERKDTIFVSILGRPSAGKSYFLASMAHQFETILPRHFGLGVTEPHPPSNTLIHSYKNALFANPNPDALVSIPATPPSGRRYYQSVRYGGEVRQYPRPMYFQIAPTTRHPNGASPERLTRTICLYDNSGEHFRPGHATPSRPETKHLSRSSALFFVFDPTREPAFMAHRGASATDPQYEIALKQADNEPQDVILSTADANVKKLLGKEVAQPLDTPLVVILAKLDAWRHIVPGKLPTFAAGRMQDTPISGFDDAVVDRVSEKMRAFLLGTSPAIVSAAERCSRNVRYVPVSATGSSPVVAGQDLGSGQPMLKFRRGALAPEWTEVPLLWTLDQLTSGLVPQAVRRDSRAGSAP